LKVALTFNVKPEIKNSTEVLSPIQPESTSTRNLSPDTYAEWDTWDTINAVRDALAEYHDVILVEANENAYEKLKQHKPDIVFNIAEGFNGISREAQMPALLEMLGIPYTGSDPLTLSICLDKARTKEILSYHRIPTAKFVVTDNPGTIRNGSLDFPLFVKPVGEGSSKGIFTSGLVKNTGELRNEVERIVTDYNQAALVEEFLPGREFTIGLIGNNGHTEVLPIVEINYSEFPKDFVPVYSYEAKWILDTKENPLEVFSCPAHLDTDLENSIKETAVRTYKTLRCRDWSRIDVRLDKNNVPNIIEVNPLPGILPDPKENSCYPKAARTAGLSYSQMINKVLSSALKRYNLQ
jgi:D-alanine-D-alanine ligase